jgi:hypothetical protein
MELVLRLLLQTAVISGARLKEDIAALRSKEGNGECAECGTAGMEMEMGKEACVAFLYWRRRNPVPRVSSLGGSAEPAWCMGDRLRFNRQTADEMRQDGALLVIASQQG